MAIAVIRKVFFLSQLVAPALTDTYRPIALQAELDYHEAASPRGTVR